MISPFAFISVLLVACMVLFFEMVNSYQIPIVNSSIACSRDQPLVVTLNLGFLQSPEFDNINYYPANKRCSWILKAPEGKLIALKNEYFSLRHNCYTDALIVYSGQPPNHKKLKILCGKDEPYLWMPETNVLYFKFISGRFPNSKGFKIYFEHYPVTVECKSKAVTCRHGTKCFDECDICDGIDDCGDGTDEENCEAVAGQLESEDICYNYAENVECGVPKISPVLESYRIVGGQPAIPGSWPWQAALRVGDKTIFQYGCGAVLIHPEWLLTAAHCFDIISNVTYWSVLMGEHFRFLLEDNEQVRYFETIHLYPDYIGSKDGINYTIPWERITQHDLALVKLNTRVFLTDYIQSICLPAINDTLEPGTECYVTGWGETNGTGFELELKQARVAIVSHENCRKSYKLNLSSSTVCAGHAEGIPAVCFGDSGSPLVYFKHNKWHLAGITSMGSRSCSSKEHPGIYTLVSYYLDWIRNVTGISATESSCLF